MLDRLHTTLNNTELLLNRDYILTMLQCVEGELLTLDAHKAQQLNSNHVNEHKSKVLALRASLHIFLSSPDSLPEPRIFIRAEPTKDV